MQNVEYPVLAYRAYRNTSDRSMLYNLTAWTELSKENSYCTGLFLSFSLTVYLSVYLCKIRKNEQGQTLVAYGRRGGGGLLLNPKLFQTESGKAYCPKPELEQFLNNKVSNVPRRTVYYSII